jgi:hypothetical protein
LESDGLEPQNDSEEQVINKNFTKRTEIAEADRIVLPSILTSDEKLDWTLRFVSASQALRREEPYPFVSRTILKLAALERDFLQTAKLYAKIIIDEKFLPVTKKTIKPANMGGIAGGLKYFQEGILFKFALDSHGLYGGDINAMKSAGHEMKCLVSLFKRLDRNYFVPMVGVIDYKGFRIIAISLLPIKGSTLVYGSNDGGRTFNSTDPVVNEDMFKLGETLNLQAHRVADGTEIRTAADVEVHKGTDGLYYLVDVARLWPPEPPSVKGSFLYRLLREEFVTNYKKPLNSDSFSGFSATEPRSKQFNADIKEAFDYYVVELVPTVAFELSQLPTEGTEVETYLHSRGINFRHMGLLWQHLPLFSPWRRAVMSEIVTRAAKSVLRSMMRRSIERFGMHNNDPFSRLIASYLNLLLGSSDDSTAYWKNELFRTIRDSFFYISKPDEEFDASTINLRDQIDDQVVFMKLLRDFGVQLKESFWKSFSIQLIFSQPTFVEDTDIQAIDPVLKRSDLGRFAIPIYMLEKTECKIKGEETVKMQKNALTTLLDKAVTRHNNIFVVFRYLCRALISQPTEVIFTHMVQISGITDQIWKILETSELAYQLNLKYFLQDLSVFLMHIFRSPPRVIHPPAIMTAFYEVFNPYYIGISFMKDKNLLKKRKVLSQDMFDEIEELDFTTTKSLWSEMLINTLAKTKNLKTVSFSKSSCDALIVQCLDERNLQLEKLVLSDLASAVDNSRVNELLQRHPKLKHIAFESYNLANVLTSITQENLESFESSTRTFANTYNPGEINEDTLTWLKTKPNLKHLCVNGLTLTGENTKKLTALIPQIERLSFKARSDITVEPFDQILALKNLTYLNLSGNKSAQQIISLSGPFKIKQFIMNDSTRCSPKLVAALIKKCPDLEFLSMKRSAFDNECCQALLDCPKLEVLHVKHSAITDEGLISIGKCKNLKVLSIGDKSRPIEDVAITHLIPIMPNLEVLDIIQYEKLEDESVKNILTAATKLHKLKLPPTIGDKAFAIKSQSIKSPLTYLNILMTKVTDAGMEMIISNFPNMQLLKAPPYITLSTFKRLHQWTKIKRVLFHGGIPDLQLGLNVWSLSINTATESRIVFAELLISRDFTHASLTIVGALGGATVNLPGSAVAHRIMTDKLFQMHPTSVLY